MHKIVFIFHFLLYPSLLFAVYEYKVVDDVKMTNINSFGLHFQDTSNTLTIEQALSENWQELDTQAAFGSNKYVQWFQYKITNIDSIERKPVLYIPYHHIKEIDIYKVHNNQIELINRTGTFRLKQNKIFETEGYPIIVNIPPNDTISIVYRINHTYRPLRATTYIMEPEYFLHITTTNTRILWLWRGVFLFALITSLILFWFVRLRMFLYYFFLNVGVGLFIGSQVGDFFLFFNSDPLDLSSIIDFTGTLLVNMFFPLFLSSLVPVKERNKILWKIIYVFIYGMIAIWTINLIPAVRSSIIMYYSQLYMMITSGIIIFLQPVLLLKSLIYKDKNAKALFIIYSIYVLTVFTSAILPNLGIISDSPNVHGGLLAASLIEIVSFMILMSRETLKIYNERESLLLLQSQHQKETVIALVKGQEEERNRVGRELHDMIGANMALIKQKVSKTDDDFNKIVNQTIESVRTLSHGLITPMVKNDEFTDEIKELGHLFSSSTLEVHIIFHAWPQIENAEITTQLYRISQELLQNAIKHSKAKNVHFQFIEDSENNLTIMYEDDGIGFDLKNIPTNGLGLKNIQNRVTLLNGNIQFDTSINKGGTTITLSIPCM